MERFLIYNFSGEVDEISHLFPSERFARIAAVIRARGGQVEILDRANFADVTAIGSEAMADLGGLAYHESSPVYTQTLDTELDRILSRPYDCIFVNLWHGTGFKFSVDLIRRLKEARPELALFGIGQKVDWFTKHILTLTGESCDGLITGLGYNAVDAIVRGCSPAETPNLIYPGPGGAVQSPREVVDVDDYPPPLYDGDVYLNLDEKVPIYQITLSNQACPNQCVFCIRPENYGRTVRKRATAAVLSEMESLWRMHGITHFRVEDSTPPRHALTDLAAAIVDSDMCGKLALSGFARIDMNSTEDFALLRKAGFVSLFFGLESLDDEGLIRLRKGITYDAVRDTLAKAHAAGIRTVGSFIFPLPRETRGSMETTLRRILELKPILDSVVVLPAGVQPPTEWGRHPEQFGIELAENYIEECLIYPIKYLVPLRHWKPLPLSYDLMDKPASEVTFEDVVNIQDAFVGTIRNDYGIVGVPDYYFLIAHLLGEEPPQVLKGIVGGMMQRDYSGLRSLFLEGGRPREDLAEKVTA